MDNGARASLIRELHAEPFAGGEANARTSVRTNEPEDPGWPAIHLEYPGSGDEPLRTGGCGARRTGQDGQ
jgi:hypothetical protein